MVLDFHSDIWSDVARRRLMGERDVLRRCHLPRLRQGGLEGAVFAFWAEADDPAGNTVRLMEQAQAEAAECDAVQIVHTVGEALQALRQGKFYIFLSVEGMAAIGEDVDWIDSYYDYGVRTAMLTWNEANALATGALGPRDRGLTAAGRRAVRRIQDKGMLMDVSHLNEKSFWDVLDVATGPICASHSNAKALCDVPRNLTDDQLRAIRDTGGVVGLNSCRAFVAPDRPDQTVERLARHAAHMIDVMGIEHVGCGLDFCEFLTGPGLYSEGEYTIGFEDAAKTQNLFEVFCRMGMTKEEQERIARGNFLALWEKTVG